MDDDLGSQRRSLGYRHATGRSDSQCRERTILAPSMTRRPSAVPLAKTGEARYRGIADTLPLLLHRLRTAPEWRRGDPVAVPPEPGIYLFTRAGRAVYVGQTRNLRQRLANHAGAKSSHNQATYAFGLAVKAANRKGLVFSGSRAAIAADPDFAEIFRTERERVARMPVRYVTIEDGDPELMTIFEVYAAIAFGTRQSFRTH